MRSLVSNRPERWIAIRVPKLATEKAVIADKQPAMLCASRSPKAQNDELVARLGFVEVFC